MIHITVNEMEVGNNESIFYYLSGSLSPGTLDIEAGEKTEIVAPGFTSDLGPPVSDGESMQWQLNSDGTGYQIISGENYYDSWIDTSAISWGTSDDSLSISLYDEDEDYYETINFLYNVENDSLHLSMELNRNFYHLFQ